MRYPKRHIERFSGRDQEHVSVSPNDIAHVLVQHFYKPNGISFTAAGYFTKSSQFSNDTLITNEQGHIRDITLIAGADNGVIGTNVSLIATNPPRI